MAEWGVVKVVCHAVAAGDGGEIVKCIVAVTDVGKACSGRIARGDARETPVGVVCVVGHVAGAVDGSVDARIVGVDHVGARVAARVGLGNKVVSAVAEAESDVFFFVAVECALVSLTAVDKKPPPYVECVRRWVVLELEKKSCYAYNTYKKNHYNTASYNIVQYMNR